MRRRDFLGTAAAAWVPAGKDAGRVMTVTGPIAPAEMGTTLPHEHLMSMFGGPPADPPSYNEAKLLETVMPALARARALGCRTIADCTTAYFGRDPGLLRRLSERSGMHVLTNTGYYGAAGHRYVPAHAYEETAEQIAARWIKEWRDGIGGTGIRPGFIKLGVNAGPLEEIDRKLIDAAARTHLETGMAMAVHTGNNPGSAREQLAILSARGVSPRAWVWVHANGVKDEASLLEAAAAGAWLEFDGLDSGTLGRHLELLRLMKRERRLGNVMLSHDGNTFPYGGKASRLYETLFRELIPAMRKDGFTELEIRRLTVENPRLVLTFGVRRNTA